MATNGPALRPDRPILARPLADYAPGPDAVSRDPHLAPPRARRLLCLAILSASTRLLAQPAVVEDEAHRLDRAATRRLNQAFLAAHPAPPAAPARPAPAGEALRQREEAAIERWRVEVAACRAAAKDFPC
jgi:hypothetical protein